MLHLAINKAITRKRVTPVPITPAVIKIVHAITEKEKILKGLNIENRTNTVLFDAAWTAGLDFEKEAFDENEEDTYYESSNEESNEETDDENYDRVDENDLTDILDEQYREDEEINSVDDAVEEHDSVENRENDSVGNTGDIVDKEDEEYPAEAVDEPDIALNENPTGVRR